MPAHELGAAGDPRSPRRGVQLLNPTPLLLRLTQSLGARGHEVVSGTDSTTARTWMLGTDDDPAAAGHAMRDGASRGDRILVVGWIGVHPDARAATLRRLWELEERCRSGPLPVLCVRLGPLVSRDAPLWRRLAHGLPGGRWARHLAHPVLEADVVETLDRALSDAAAWGGWYELGGPDVLRFAELAALARAANPAPGGAWEPDLESLAEQRLIEPEIWARWIGFNPGSVMAEVRRWAA